MITELTSKEYPSNKADIIYIDFVYDAVSDIESSFTDLGINRMNQQDDYPILSMPKVFTKSIHMGLTSTDVDLELFTATFLQDNIKENDTFPQLNLIDVLDDNKKLIRRINQISFFIANEGRIGTANTLVMNHNMFQYDYSELAGINIVFNKYVPDDVFYIIRNNNIDQPGYKFVYHIDENNKLYFAFTSFGFFPEKQAVKLVLY